MTEANLPFEDWISVLGSERLTGALLDRLTNLVSILTMNGDSYRLKGSAGNRRAAATQAGAARNQTTTIDPDKYEITKGCPPTPTPICKKAPNHGLVANNRAEPEPGRFYTATMAWNPTGVDRAPVRLDA